MKRNDKHRPSMAEVAKSAGVSHQTVSRVVNSRDGVKPETRRRVEEAIAKLGYRRNAMARTLVTSQSHLIGVITVDTSLNGPLQTLAAIERAARDEAYQTLFASVRGSDLEEFDATVNSFLSFGIDSLVVIASRENLVEHANSLDIGIPILLVGPEPGPYNDKNRVCINQSLGAQIAIEHLIEVGHSEIGMITGPRDWIDAQQRFAGASSTCFRRGVNLVTFEGDWSAEQGYQCGLKFADLDVSNRPTGVFAVNDASALGFIAALKGRGVNVPGDVSVIGFDDVPSASFFGGGLTTVRQDFDALGRAAVQALLAQSEDVMNTIAPIKPELVVRKTVVRP